MPIEGKTFSNMIETALNNLLDRTSITNVAGDSRARILLELPLSELADLWQSLDILERNSFISTATGLYLDAIGELMAINRLPSQKAITSGPVFKFYVNSALGYDIYIPAGTRVWPPSDPTVSFITRTPVTLVAGELEVFTVVEAVDEGSYYTVGAFSLTSHAINNADLHCINTYPITSGTDEEDDDNYRYRIKSAVQMWARCNATSIRTGLLEIPGVRDIVLKPYFRGTGSVDVLIYSHFPNVPENLITRVQEELDERLAAFGIRATAIAPSAITVGVRATVGFKSKATADQRGIIRKNIKSAIEYYLDNLEIGEAAFVDQIDRVALNTSELVDELNIHFIEVEDSVKLPENIFVEEDERIIAGNILIS